MKRLIRITLVSSVIVLIFVPLTLIFFALEHGPLVFDTQTINTDNAVQTGRFAKKLAKDLLENSDKPHVFSATEEELNALFAVGHRSIPEAAAVSTISPELFEVEATLKVPHNPAGDYLNFRLNLLPSASGFRVARATIGDLFLTDTMVRFLAGAGLDLAFGYREGRKLLHAVDAVVLREGQIDVHLKPISELRRMVQHMKERARLLRDEAAMLGDPEHIRLYYAALTSMAKTIPADKPVSLSYFMEHLFQMALNRGGNPVLENRAAILALGIYWGTWRVEQMTGPVRTAQMKREARPAHEVVLGERVDLRLHFLISAVLQIASESGITHAIGEFKELLDAGEGGSGFSFVDLAADRAGVRFAEAATSASTARQIQQHFSRHQGEDQFFPKIDHLPEGLSQEAFERHFGNIESEGYLQLVASVDACLDQLPAYAAEERLAKSGGCDMSYVVPSALIS